jgi:hypothetical protein
VVWLRPFDDVNHEILLTKLYYFRIKGTMANWFKSCLTDRKQKMEIKSQNTYSKWRTIEHGIPQGSIVQF